MADQNPGGAHVSSECGLRSESQMQLSVRDSAGFRDIRDSAAASGILPGAAVPGGQAAAGRRTGMIVLNCGSLNNPYHRSAEC